MAETIAGALALLLGLMVVFGAALMIHWGRNWQKGFAPYIFYPIVFVVALSALTSGRNMSVADLTEFVETAAHPAVTWLGRLTSLFVLFACGERLLSRLFKLGGKPDVPRLLLVALWVYFLTNIVSPALFGRHRSISHEYLYVLLAGHAALLATREGAATMVTAVRNALLLFLLASAACLAWRVDLVLGKNYHGLIPFLTVRYAGLSNHPNSLGPLTVIFMLCLWRQPLPWRQLNRGGWLLGLVSLLLTQSKTSWIAFLACMACLLWFGQREQLRRWLADYRNPHLPVSLLFALMAGGVVLCYGFMFTGLSSKIDHFLMSRAGADLVSLTGRDQIWRVALDEWSRNPVFGYGLTIWDTKYRLSVGLPAAFHAHSQFYQSLSSAGLIGVAGLVVYVTVLLFFVARTARSSGGMAPALLLLILSRSVSEVPLSMTGLSVEQIAHVLLLVVVAAHYVPRQSARAAGTVVAPWPSERTVA